MAKTETTNAGPIDINILKQCVSNELGVPVADVSVDADAISVGGGTDGGTTSQMLFVSLEAAVKGKTTRHEYVAKVVTKEGDKAQMVTEINLFDMEIANYAELLPAVQSLAGPKYHVSVPECYFSSKEKGMIIMENLTKKGFGMVDKAKGFDMDHIKLMMVQFANMHATSYHLGQTEACLDGGFKKTYPHVDRGSVLPMGSEKMKEVMVKVFTKPFLTSLSALKVLRKEDKDLVQRMETFEATAVDKYKALMELDNDDFKVVNFGDCWVNNMMFRNDSAGKPLEVKLYDLQTSYRGSPAYDLLYFLMSSVPPALRKEKLQESLAFYHAQLTERLESYGHKNVYSLDQLRKEHREKYLFGFVIANIHMKNALLPAKDSAKYDVDLAVNTPAVRTRILELADEAVEMGLF